MTSIILPDMKAKRRGAIVNIASVLGIAPSPFHSAYVYQLTKALRYESRGSGVTIQTVCPGFVNTQMISYCESFQTKSAFLSPPAEKYAKHAILTLGAADFTAGYYVHEFKTISQV
ncbi:hypothetical protein B566_EDAN005862 [Ephemera danica]|nr:hypothetical protein B566_EDAN005862 [Ephemera danica]